MSLVKRDNDSKNAWVKVVAIFVSFFILDNFIISIRAIWFAARTWILSSLAYHFPADLMCC